MLIRHNGPSNVLKPRKRSSVTVSGISGNSYELPSRNRWTFPIVSEENWVKTRSEVGFPSLVPQPY